MKKATIRNIFIFVLALICIIAALFANSFLSYRMGTATKDEGVLYVPGDATYESVIDSLTKLDVLKNLEKFERFARMKGLPSSFHTGRYEVTKGMSYGQLIGRIRGGMQSPVRVTFNNVRTLDQFAGVISKILEPDSASLYKYFTDHSVEAEYGLTGQTMISLFIPNTYELYWGVTPEGFVKRMKREYDTFWNEERQKKLEKTGLTREEAITLASIVYEETKMSDEMPRVAGVYMNRLNVGMILQADPTVKFAVGDFTIKRVLNRHKATDSPYNTYKYTGLPPGPICMPSIRAIDAVLNYEDHSYIFFCASPDYSGYHKFAKSLSEHNRNADQYHIFLDEQGIK